jgi:Tfp pilus assembly protein PilW
MALGLVLGTGCSSSGSMSSSSSTTRAPEDILVSSAQVATGLAALQTLAGTASSEAKTNPEAAKKTATRAHDQWAKVEGRVKKNDPDAYLQFEDALTNLTVGAKDQDAAKVARGASGVATAAAAYLAKYPG